MGDAFSVPLILSCSEALRVREIIVLVKSNYVVGQLRNIEIKQL